MLPDRTDALVGSMLGKDYRVLEPIGVGGMAIVYLVEHQTLLKRFAAKVLSSALASSLEARARFTQEAHAASQLDHENIVTISDFGVTVDQRPFFVMELLRGRTLDQRLATGRMTLEEVVAVCVPVARALAHAHAEGIVHLDVKPENIFLVQRSQGRLGVKVVDFGIAKTPQNPRLAKPEETAGSPLFMAPEVCRGDDDVDQRADVYSFGILLYLMMCGRLPFVDDSLHRILQMQLVQLPAPPREVNSELSPELAVIVERALAKERNDRYPSMEALLHDLEAALPAGADRLLIEAVSGTALQDTPFAGALGRRDSARSRTSRPPPIAMRSIPPAAPSRVRLPIVLAAMVASIVLGLVIWRQIAEAPTAAARGRDHDALASPSPVAVPQPQIVVAAPPRSAEPAEAPVGAPPTTPVDEAQQAPEVIPPAVAAAPSDDSPAAADDEPSPAPPAGAMTAAVAPMAAEAAQIGRPAAVAKRPLVRPKPLPYREVPRPPRRVASIVSVGSPAPAAPPITTPAGLQVADPGGAAPATAPSELGHGDHSDGGAHAAIAVAVLPPPPPPPAVAAPPPPPPPNPGTLDATPSVVTLDVKGSLSPAIVRRSVERTLSAMRACYRTAARAAGATPALDLRLTFEINENSRSSQVLAQILAGGAGFGSLESCAAGVTSQIRTQEAPDVGTAQVTVVIRFRPS